MWGEGCNGVYITVCVKWNFLWGPVVVVNFKDGGGVDIFFGCHSCPVDGFYGSVVIRGVCQTNTFSQGLCLAYGAEYFVPVVGGSGIV